MCNNGHTLIEGLALRFFNCMRKNLVRDLTENESYNASRKIRKLTGQINALQSP